MNAAAWRRRVLAGVALCACWRGAAGQSGQDVADAVHRAALLNLRLVAEPTPDDHRLLYRVLELARPIAPADEELVRRMTTAAWGAGDPALLRSATEALVRIAPNDTVAQLRLITGNIERQQTVEDRVALYDRLLGPAGERLDPSVRSRLAFDAALLHREQGQLDRFRDRLTQAIELDETHKEAIQFAAGYYAQTVGDPVGFFELQLRVLRADPLDPNVHLSIARTLAAEGVLQPASVFHQTASLLLAAADETSPQRDVERLSLAWLIQGPGVVVAEIERRLRTDRGQAEEIYKAQRAQDVPESELTPPEKVHLDALYERIRLLAALADLDEAGVDDALGEFTALAQEAFDQIRRPEVRADAERLEQAVEAAAIRYIDLQFMLAIANRPLGDLDENVAKLVQTRPNWARDLLLLQAWRLFRSGEADGASDLLDRRGLNTDRDQMLRGLIAESRGNVDEALRFYQQMIRVDPLGPLGAWAKSRSLRIMRIDNPVTELGMKLGSMLDGIPEWLLPMVTNPRLFMGLSIEAIEGVDGGGPLPRFRVKLTNLAPGPMAVGSDRPINSQLLLTPNFRDAPAFIGDPQSEVVEFNRRLRLGQRESIEAVVSGDLGYAALAAMAIDDRLVRNQWRLIQGFRIQFITATGTRRLAGMALVPGPLCLSTETDSLLRTAGAAAALSPAELAAVIAAGGDDAAFAGAVRGAAGLLYRVQAGESAADVGPVVTACAEAVLAVPPLRRAFMLAVLPGAATVPAMAAFDEAARRVLVDSATTGVASDRLTVSMTLLTRVGDAGDPILASAMTSDDAVSAEIAALLAGRLGAGVPTLATTGPGLGALAGAGRVGPANNGR